MDFLAEFRNMIDISKGCSIYFLNILINLSFASLIEHLELLMYADSWKFVS